MAIFGDEPKEIISFEEKLYDLKKSIRDFNEKVSVCNLHGLIDIAQKIEQDVKILDKDLERIERTSTKSWEEIRNIRLSDSLNKLRREYDNGKTMQKGLDIDEVINEKDLIEMV